MLTRRHFELIAWVLRRYAEDRNGGTMPCGLAEAFADALAGTNGRFDRERFIRAATPAPRVRSLEVAS